MKKLALCSAVTCGSLLMSACADAGQGGFAADSREFSIPGPSGFASSIPEGELQAAEDSLLREILQRFDDKTQDALRTTLAPHAPGAVLSIQGDSVAAVLIGELYDVRERLRTTLNQPGEESMFVAPLASSVGVDRRRQLFRSGKIPIGLAIAPEMPKELGDIAILRRTEQQPHDVILLRISTPADVLFKRGFGALLALHANFGACPTVDEVVAITTDVSPPPGTWQQDDDGRARAMMQRLQGGDPVEWPRFGPVRYREIWITRMHPFNEGPLGPPASDTLVCP